MSKLQKHSVATNREQTTDTQNGLNKVEGILTSPIKLKELKEGQSYFWAFFQLEGIEQDIPVIFKIKPKKERGSQSDFDRKVNQWLDDKGFPREVKPKIPLRSKVLLEGKWAESNHSTRPSFTCTIYEILAEPSPITIKNLREQISQLLTTSLEKKQEWNQRVDYLFRKQKDLAEIDKLTKLGSEYLSAYLLIRRAFYANYQDNLLPDTAHLTQPEKYLAKLAGEIEEIAQHIRAYEAISRSKEYFLAKSPHPSLTNEELLRMLGQRLTTGEIKANEIASDGWSSPSFNYLYSENGKGQWTESVELETGKTETSQSKE